MEEKRTVYIGYILKIYPVDYETKLTKDQKIDQILNLISDKNHLSFLDIEYYTHLFKREPFVIDHWIKGKYDDFPTAVSFANKFFQKVLKLKELFNFVNFEFSFILYYKYKEDL